MTPTIYEPTSTIPGITKLEMLRKLMHKKKVDAFLVPRADCHQGEFISDSDARLTWLSGFTGSAGLCIVTLEDIVLFVDGRYSIQAEIEKNIENINVLKLERKEIVRWLRLNLGSPGVIAFDPWLHTIREIRFLESELKPPHKIKPVLNLIDKLWKDKPKERLMPIYRLSEKYTGSSYQEKLKKVSQMMIDSATDFVIYSLPDSICWLLNIRGQDIPNTPVVKAFAIQDRNAKVEVYLEMLKIPNSIANELGTRIKFFPIESIGNRLKKLKGKIWLDSESCPFAIKKLLKTNKTVLHENKDPSSNLKALKNHIEINGFRSAHLKDGLAMVKFLYWLSKNRSSGLDEITIIKSLEEFRTQGKGYKGPAFDTICGSGSNAAIIHYRANEKTNRILKSGDILLLDSGGQYLEGTTDITRTIPIGRSEKRKKKHFTLVLKGMIAISRLKWPAGLSGRDLDSVARYNLWQEGLDYDHGTGHGVGCFLSVHEGPQAISKRNEVELKPGMIISNEPGLYVSGSHGIRIENLLLVKGTKANERENKRPMLSFETLTLCPIDKELLLPELLTKEEIDWLNDYHKLVKLKLARKLGLEIRKWLFAACSAL